MNEDDIKFVIQTLREAEFSTGKQSSDQDKAVWIMMQAEANVVPPWVTLDVHTLGEFIDRGLELNPNADEDSLAQLIRDVETMLKEINA